MEVTAKETQRRGPTEELRTGLQEVPRLTAGRGQGGGAREGRTGLLDCRGPRPQAASPEAATERAEQVLEETEADGELVRDERRPSACRLRSGAQRAWRTHPRKTWGPRKGTLRGRRSARQPEGRRAAMAWRTRRRERKRHAHKSLVAAAGGPLSCSPQTQS